MGAFLYNSKISFTNDQIVFKFLLNYKYWVFALIFSILYNLLKCKSRRFLKVEFLSLLVRFLNWALGSTSFNNSHNCFFISLLLFLFLDCLLLDLLNFLQILSHEILFWRQWFRNLWLVLFLRLVMVLRANRNMIQLFGDQLHLDRLFNRLLNNAVFPSFIYQLFSGTLSQFLGWFDLLFLRMR